MKLMKLLLLVMSFLGISNSFAADLTVEQVALDAQGETVSTTCVNSKGFYLDVGLPSKDHHIDVYGVGIKLPLNHVVHNLLFPGWRVVWGSYVHQQQKIQWQGKKTWSDWLKTLAFDYNLAIVVDWNTKTLYIHRL